MVYVLALAAALSNALTSVFQRMGVEDAPEEATMRLSLITHALRRGIWLLGFLFMVCSFLLQAFALHVGRLSVVQPILVMELLFLVFILGTYFGYQITLREWVGASAITFGLAGFLAFSNPGGGNHVPSTFGWSVVGGICVFAMVVCVVATRWGPRFFKAAMFGTAAAVAFAFTAALMKVVSDYAARDWVTMLTHWQTYALVAFGLAGLFLTTNAYHAGPLAASQSTLVLVDPLASILIGIALYGDSLRTSGPWGPLEAFSLLVMFSGAVFLSSSPLVTGIKSEGKGVEYEEMLSRRVKHFGEGTPEAPVPDGGLPFSPT
ncbi:MAG TPA: DMT family transporter [Acidimicrobiales bacterium]|nr:DMT family transporter [Acidimicrobiales bacterium]